MTTMNAFSADQRREPWLHTIARESRNILRVLVGALIIATVVTMVAAPFWGAFPAILLLLAYGMLWIANIAEHRSRIGKHVPIDEAAQMSPVDVDELESERQADTPVETPEAMKEIPLSIVLKESITFAEIIVGFAVAAVIVAALLFHWSLLLIAALFLFPYMIILLAPVWLGGFSKELERQARREQLDH
jgi:hypothetical protein